MLISLTEYAKRNGKDPATARQRAGRGSFKTAVKIGRDWLIDEDEVWADGRVRSGNFVGKHPRKTLDNTTQE